MSQQIRGVVAHKQGDPVSVETIVIPDRGPGEAVVKVQACGVCHTDLHRRCDVDSRARATPGVMEGMTVPTCDCLSGSPGAVVEPPVPARSGLETEPIRRAVRPPTT